MIGWWICKISFLFIVALSKVKNFLELFLVFHTCNICEVSKMLFVLIFIPIFYSYYVWLVVFMIDHIS